MLNREKSKIIWALLLVAGLISCTEEYDRKENFYRDKLEDESLVNLIRSRATDTIKSWINKDLKYFHKFRKEAKNIADWRIDEWIFMDSKKNKCLISILVKTFYNSTQDDIYYILGEKHGEQWWFYAGSDLVVIQQNYVNDSSQEVLPFNTLSEIARQNVLNWYFVEKEAGICIKELLSSGYSSYKKCSDEEYLINDEYFENGFNWGADREAHSDFLKEKYNEDN